MHIAFKLNSILTHQTRDSANQLIISSHMADNIAVLARIQRSQIWAKVLFAQRNLILAEEAHF